LAPLVAHAALFLAIVAAWITSRVMPGWIPAAAFDGVAPELIAAAILLGWVAVVALNRFTTAAWTLGLASLLPLLWSAGLSLMPVWQR
jgi:hypothetical protein